MIGAVLLDPLAALGRLGIAACRTVGSVALFALEALLRLHLTVEEEVLAGFAPDHAR